MTVPSRSWKKRVRNSPLELSGGTSHANTVILALSDSLQTFEYNSKRMNLCHLYLEGNTLLQQQETNVRECVCVLLDQEKA